MKIIENKITEYVTANFTEDETVWTSGATFNYGEETRDGHYIYKYAGTDATNTSDTPSLNILALVPTWVKIAPSNYYAMLDGVTGTQTENADTIEITIADNNYNSFALLEVEASSVVITLKDNATSDVLFTKTLTLLDTTSIVDFFSYSFEELYKTPSLYADNIPLYADATMTVLIDNTGSVAKCGRLVFGRSFYVGDTGYGVNLSLESYSRKSVDVFGNASLVHRQSVNIDSYEVHIPTPKIPMLRRKFKELDAVALLFVMDESEDSILENLLNYGYWQDFSIVIPNASLSTISLSIKGIL